MRTLSGVALTIGIALLARADLIAQDKEDRAEKETPSVVPRFFDRPIDFWGRGQRLDRESDASGKAPAVPAGRPTPKSQASDWSQVVRLPDGTLSVQELPRPLVEVLEHPTPDNIRAYFEWRMTKARKILRAAELMKEYRLSTGDQPAPGGAPAGGMEKAVAPPAPEKSTAPAAATAKAGKPGPFGVTYFHKKGCPHCDTQDGILAQWLRDNPEGKLEVVEFGMKPELWRTFQVRGTPSLVVSDLGTGRTTFLEGLSRPEALDQALGECRAPAPDKAAAAKGEPK